MKTIFISIFCLVILISISAIGQNQGEPAPDFTLDQLSGGTFKLSGQSGKVVFIFWLGYDCPFCKSASPSVKSQIIDEFSSRNDFVAIGVDTWNGSTTAVNAFKSSTGLDINYLLMGRTVADNYGTAYDHLSVVNKDGILVHKGTLTTSSDIPNAKAAISSALQIATSASALPENILQFDNYPNPFSSNTTIRFELEKTGLVELEVFDISGKKVTKVIHENYPAGKQQVTFNRGQLDSGIYFLRLKNEGKFSTQKMFIR